VFVGRKVCEGDTYALATEITTPEAVPGRYSFASFLDGELLGECEFDITE
jgi:hypothetical protein